MIDLDMDIENPFSISVLAKGMIEVTISKLGNLILGFSSNRTSSPVGHAIEMFQG
jgi:hypothetical protein